MIGLHADTASHPDNHPRGPAAGNGGAGASARRSVHDLEDPLSDAESATDVLIELIHQMEEGELKRVEVVSWAAYRLKDHIKELWDVYEGLVKAQQPVRQ